MSRTIQSRGSLSSPYTNNVAAEFRFDFHELLLAIPVQGDKICLSIYP